MNNLGQYFDEELFFRNPQEIFCDCGAFTGDTIPDFINYSNGQYEKYIAIEPDENNLEKLHKRICDNNYCNVQVYPLACWDKKTDLYFDSNESSGTINESGTNIIHADTLDNILKDEEITFLKMDIEGAEEKALYGSRSIIQKNHPILTICIYHKFEDYFRLPLLIKEFYDGYNFFIRHYKDMFSHETVCYAVPDHRMVKKIEKAGIR